jgi:hypothetical protein
MTPCAGRSSKSQQSKGQLRENYEVLEMLKKAIAVLLAVMMIGAGAGVTVFAATGNSATYEPTQAHYFWWFGDPTFTPGHYPEFQLTPMGDEAVVGYTRDGDYVTFDFEGFWYPDPQGSFGYFDEMIIDGVNVLSPPDPVTGAAQIVDIEVSPQGFIVFDSVTVLIGGRVHIPLSNVYLEVDY